MILNTSISEIMTQNPITLESSDPLWEAEKTFSNHHLRHAPVLREGELVGMLSKDDFKRLVPANTLESDQGAWDYNPYPNQYVNQLMTPDPFFVQANSSIKEAAKILAEKEFHALPVLDGNRVVGIISTTDMIRYLLEHCE